MGSGEAWPRGAVCAASGAEAGAAERRGRLWEGAAVGGAWPSVRPAPEPAAACGTRPGEGLCGARSGQAAAGCAEGRGEDGPGGSCQGSAFRQPLAGKLAWE